MLHLRPRESRLNLGVPMAALPRRQPLLPPMPTVTLAPDEQLPPLQPLPRRLHQPGPGAVDSSDPRPLTRERLEEEVHRAPVPHRIREVHTLIQRYVDQVEPAPVSEPPGLIRRDEDSRLRGLLDRDVRPPVRRDLGAGRVLQ